MNSDDYAVVADLRATVLARRDDADAAADSYLRALDTYEDAMRELRLTAQRVLREAEGRA